MPHRAKPDLLISGGGGSLFQEELAREGLAPAVTFHVVEERAARDAVVAEFGGRIRGLIRTFGSPAVDRSLIERLPKLELIASIGVGYDVVDTDAAAARGIVVTNTPGVLDEEVADAALGLLLATVRELPNAERYLRAGRWLEAPYPASKASLRNRTVGIVGLGRIGKAVARRLDAFGVPVVYHGRTRQPGVGYRYYPDLTDMARDVDTLIVVVPGGAGTRHMIDADVLKALGPDGVVINVARGSVIDQPALIAALENRTIHSAGLDVFADEPRVPAELVAMEHVVLLPHVGSRSELTVAAMRQLVIDNVRAWLAGKPPLTPVPETPWKGRWGP